MPSPLKNFDVLPKSYFDEHMWVDYIELLCLIQSDRLISKNDVLDRVRIKAEDLYEGQEDNMNDDPDEAVSGDNLHELQPAELNDKWASRVNNWFSHLNYRAGAFGTSYPFLIAETGDVLEVKDTSTTEQKLYVFLLLCSNLRLCEGSTDSLTKTFERLCKEAVKQCLPVGAEVHIFGTSENIGGRYSGSLWQKINTLAKDLGETVKLQKSDLAPSDYGDGGLDIVAWVPLGDDNSHRIVIFGQCACTLEWKIKQYTAIDLNWRQKINLSPSVITLTFIPHTLRRADGSWHDKSNIATILIDRPRFMHLIGNRLVEFNGSSGYEFAERVIAHREEIY